MTESFISTKDRIISTAIDIISESGLSNLTTKTVSMKANLSEPLLYRFYGDISELLIDVVKYFFRFDKSIQKTIQAREGSWTDKIRAYVEDYAIYYENYSTLSTLMLQYEEMLHFPSTREIMIEGSTKRREFMQSLFRGAIEAGEIRSDLDPNNLTDLTHGFMHITCLKRRLGVEKGSFRQDMCRFVNKMIEVISI